MSSGIDLIAAERSRQIEAEGWTPDHDVEHSRGELAMAAACYATFAGYNAHSRNWKRGIASDHHLWPFGPEWWKPGKDDSNESRIRELTKAGALIAAEIDRLQRQSTP